MSILAHFMLKPVYPTKDPQGPNLCTVSKIRSGSFGGPLGGPFWRSEVIEEGHSGKVRRLMGVILAK